MDFFLLKLSLSVLELLLRGAKWVNSDYILDGVNSLSLECLRSCLKEKGILEKYLFSDPNDSSIKTEYNVNNNLCDLTPYGI